MADACFEYEKKVEEEERKEEERERERRREEKRKRELKKGREEKEWQWLRETLKGHPQSVIKEARKRKKYIGKMSEKTWSTKTVRSVDEKQ